MYTKIKKILIRIYKIFSYMESIDNHRNWPININAERELCHNAILNEFIIIPNECPYCHKGSINLRNNNSLVNPIIGNVFNIFVKEKYIFVKVLYLKRIIRCLLRHYIKFYIYS